METEASNQVIDRQISLDQDNVNAPSLNCFRSLFYLFYRYGSITQSGTGNKSGMIKDFQFPENMGIFVSKLHVLMRSYALS